MTTRKAARAASYLKARAGGFAAEELHHARGHDPPKALLPAAVLTSTLKLLS